MGFRLDRTYKRRAYWWQIGPAVAIGVLLSGFSFEVARVLEDQRISRELEIGAANRVMAVQRGFNEQLRLLQSVAAFWTASEEVHYDEFQTFVTPLFPHEAQMQAIGWSPVVLSGERMAIETEARLQGLTGFRITERNAAAGLVPAAARDIYVPVMYIEPLVGNEAALGFDLWSEDRRRSALEATRDTGVPHTTRRLQLVQASQPRDGLLSALAVYRGGAAPDTVADRRRALIGYVTQVSWIDQLIERELSNLLPGGVDLFFLDPVEGPDSGPVYVHSSRLRPESSIASWRPDLEDTTPIYRSALDVGGRQWRVLGVPAPGFLASRRGPLPWVLLAVGLLGTGLGIGWFVLSQRSTRRLSRAHEELEVRDARLRNVAESMPALLVAFDENGTAVAWNQECERVTGYSRDEIVGNPRAAQLLYPDPDYLSGIREQAEASGGAYRDWECTLTAKDGSSRVVAWSNLSADVPIPGWSSWELGIDVTERHRAARERQEMQEQLLQSQKLESLGLLAGGIAHDFNNLLTAILGNASLAQESLATSSPARVALDGVVQASQRAALLTQQLLAYTGKGTFNTQPIDLSEHVREIGSLLQSAIPKKVVLRFELATDLPAIDADAAQMQQLVMNLVINGAEAAGSQPGVVYVRTGLQEVDETYARTMQSGAKIDPGTYVYLEVQDDGEGMDADTQGRIFDPFFSTKFTGRGLGLAAALGIVRSHGGSLKVYSAKGKGSVFKVLLPPSGETVRRGLTSSDPPEQCSGLILVVDDEPMILQLAARALKDLGYRVLTATDGSAAIEIFKEQGSEIDCVLLDMTMPKLDGEETFRALRGMQADVTAILSSGYNEVAATQRFVGKGLAGFLQKPYTAVELAAKIGEVLRARQHENPSHAT